MVKNDNIYYKECESEKLHLIGGIQTGGCLMAGDNETDTIHYVSKNISDCLDTDQTSLLGKNLSSLYPELFSKLSRGTETRKIILGAIKINSVVYDAVYSRREVGWILELFPANEQANADYEKFHFYQKKLYELANHFSNQQQLNETLLSAIYELSGFDHIMIYHFFEDDSGEVIAEKNHGVLDNYLGLRFPASDIPQSARRLYQLNPYRSIPDISSPLIEISHDSAYPPLDLTYSDLRATSPVHLQYLQNMGVKASLSFPIIFKGELYGMVACHAANPTDIYLNTKEICSALVNIYATAIKYYQIQEQLQIFESLENFTDIYRKFLLNHNEKETSISETAYKLIEILQASSLLYFDGKNLSSFGQIPDDKSISVIRKWINAIDEVDVFHTDKLPGYFPDANFNAEQASGLLLVRFHDFNLNSRWIAWLRPELPSIINWAGNPKKPFSTVEKETNIKIQPRESFKRWQIKMKEISAPWTKVDTLIANRLHNLGVNFLKTQ